MQVFNSRVQVDKDAQKVVSEQQHKSLVLDISAKVYSKPELEIYADDVKCNHGSAIGQLDQSNLFYLQTRGLNEEEAKALLLSAFAKEMSLRWSKFIQESLNFQLNESFLSHYNQGYMSVDS